MWRLTCDGDQHINEPRHLYEKWLPTRHRDAAPRVIRTAAGVEVWQAKDRQVLVSTATNSCPGRTWPEISYKGVPYEEMRPGEYDAHEHLKDMDVDGIYSACFFPGGGSRVAQPADGRDYYLACLQAWNDFMIDEWCAVDPDRLIALPRMPATGLEDAVLELKRVAQKGARGVQMSAYPNGTTDLQPADDRFWAEAQELDVPVSIHVGFGAARNPRAGGPSIVNINASRAATDMRIILGEFVLTGVFERFPRLTFLSAETGVGWLPFFMEQTDDNYQRHRFWSGINLKLRPSEYIKRQVLATFQVDTMGVRDRHYFSVDNIVWSSDYPHSGCDWPNSQKLIDYHMTGVPEDEKWKMVGGNYARLFKLKGPSTGSGQAPLLIAGTAAGHDERSSSHGT